MKVHSYALSMLFMFGLTLFFSSCGDDDTTMEEPTIVDFAVDNPDFSILVDALTAANLVSVLDDRTAEFTVFAPNNAAFEAFLAANNFDELSDVPVDLLLSLIHI